MHILWLKTELLHPVDKGGRIRTYQMLRALRREHQVTYLALDDGRPDAEPVHLSREYCDRLVRVPFKPTPKGTAAFWRDLAANVVSPLPYAVAKYRAAEMTREIREIVAKGDVDLVVCDFLFPAINVPDGLPCPVVLFQHNVEASIWRRHAAVAHTLPRKLFMGEQWRRMQRYEAEQCARFDHVVAVSPQDEEMFRTSYGVQSSSWVPTGVDTTFFRPSGTISAEPHNLVFTGSMDWMPNEDGVLFFTEKILPRIQQAVPDVTLTVVGREPTAAVVALAAKNRALRVTGRVPDVRPEIERSSVFVVPLRVGGGTRLKIYEAMAMEKPVVSTAIGAEGLPVRDGEDIVIASEPDAFADAVIALLRNPARAGTIGRRGAAAVRSQFGWEGVAARFAETCSRVAGRELTQLLRIAG